MFTGIVEETGSIRSLRLSGSSGKIAIRAKKVLGGTRIGDSIAVNGVCLTVVSLEKDGFTADVMAETVRRTNLGATKIGVKVNLERAMAADGRFGGHIVAGHIDGTGMIEELRKEENAVQYNQSRGKRKPGVRQACDIFSGQHRGDRYKADPSADPAVSGRRLCDDV